MTDEEEELMLMKIKQIDYNRLVFINEEYILKHEWIYNISNRHFTQEFLELINNYNTMNMINKKDENNKNDNILLSFLNQITPTKVYKFTMFSKEFCDSLIEELENFENR